MKIHYYAHQGDIAGVERELAQGVSIDEIDAKPVKFTNANYFFPKWTPLQCAIYSSNAGADTIKFLIDRGAKLSLTPKQLAEEAIRSRNTEKIRLLLDLGVDINYVRDNASIDICTDKYNSGNIFRYSQAAATEDILLLRFWIEQGIDLSHCDANGNSALLAAYNINRWEIVRFLVDAGCDPAGLKWSDLMHAVVLGTVSEVEVQLKQGVITLHHHFNPY